MLVYDNGQPPTPPTSSAGTASSGLLSTLTAACIQSDPDGHYPTQCWGLAGTASGPDTDPAAGGDNPWVFPPAWQGEEDGLLKGQGAQTNILNYSFWIMVAVDVDPGNTGTVAYASADANLTIQASPAFTPGLD